LLEDVQKVLAALSPHADARGESAVDIQVITSLERHAQAWLAPGLAGQAGIPDVVQRFLIAVTEGKVPNDVPSAVSYFKRAVRNASIDEYRRLQRLSFDDEAAASVVDPDDQILRLLAPSADRALIAAGLKWSRTVNDVTVIKVVRTWLNLAKLSGKQPSERVVGQELGLSQEAVRKALQRFRNRISNQLDP
jgi:DNA-directed RNA polymerase specialized sigma24 family protein